MSKSLWSDCENGVDIIKEYFREQMRFIQSATEKKIEQINKLNDDLIEIIKEYERKCIESYLNENQSKHFIKEEINRE